MDQATQSELFLFASWLEGHGFLKPAFEGPVRGGLSSTGITRLYLAVDGDPAVAIESGQIVAPRKSLSEWKVANG